MPTKTQRLMEKSAMLRKIREAREAKNKGEGAGETDAGHVEKVTAERKDTDKSGGGRETP